MEKFMCFENIRFQGEFFDNGEVFLVAVVIKFSKDSFRQDSEFYSI